MSPPKTPANSGPAMVVGDFFPKMPADKIGNRFVVARSRVLEFGSAFRLPQIGEPAPAS